MKHRFRGYCFQGNANILLQMTLTRCRWLPLVAILGTAMTATAPPPPAVCAGRIWTGRSGWGAGGGGRCPLCRRGVAAALRIVRRDGALVRPGVVARRARLQAGCNTSQHRAELRV